MIDLETGQAAYYWTDDGTDEWNTDLLESPVISEDRIAFDYPCDEWQPDDRLVEMKREADGYFHLRNERQHWWGVRADTATHVIVTGNWLETPRKGVFIAVLPKMATG